MSTERIEKMFKQIGDNKLASAKDSFDTIMASKIQDAFEAKRVEVGQQMIQTESVEDELDEGIAAEIKKAAKSTISTITNAKEWHDLMRTKYGTKEWNEYWKKNNKGVVDKILNTGFNESVDELDEAADKWVVTFKKATYSGVSVDEEPVYVNAQSSREAITRAGKKVGLSKNDALTAKTKDVSKA